jgi:hypothetical protein
MGLRVATAALMVLILSCGPSETTLDTLRSQTEVYSARVSFAWQNLSTFQLRGNARLDGSSLVARGPFVLWGDPERILLRGDFYGPDGKPVVSIVGDSTGLLVYLPQDEYASFAPLGLQAGGGTIRTADLIFLLRTGFPLRLEQWQIVDLAEYEEGRIIWSFRTAEDDTMTLAMESGYLFPGQCSWDGGTFTINSSSPHDEYRAWPWSWSTRIGDNVVDLELTDITITQVPWEGIWGMFIPVPVDSLEQAPVWFPSDTLMQR